mmetsp:Transcript_38795/g.91232  ORF Transcript_38795/g.91232 Transcript_38795/m.91232 type:complete len:80 (-) Transcript_38795:149-388(-)
MLLYLAPEVQRAAPLILCSNFAHGIKPRRPCSVDGGKAAAAGQGSWQWKAGQHFFALLSVVASQKLRLAPDIPYVRTQH